MNDVCLLLEGTYPYVSGGVSSWVSDIITRMSDISFSILYIGPHSFSSKKIKYEIPHNVYNFSEIYLFEYEARRTKQFGWRKKDLSIVEDFIVSIKKNDTSAFYELVKDIRKRKIDLHDIVFSYDSWKILEHVYRSEAKTFSFIDYFWTWRFIYMPFFSLLLTDIPPARVYHSVSTGYAGVIGALAKYEYNRPFILTEHGLYTRERKIDISQADWIYSTSKSDSRINEGDDFFKEWWARFFSFLSTLAYDQSDEILTLYGGNQKAQIEEGADPLKTKIIPNGVDYKFFNNLRTEKKDNTLRIGFMGRVVPIKDIKTFIMACNLVHNEIQDIEVYIMGPTDEDEDYFEECQMLVEMQNLKNIIHFTGKIDIKEYYPMMDVIVLTSVSEGQPLVILEAGACGIPVVATDVGACSELLYGRSMDDQLMGKSGIITPISDPTATAEAIIRILSDKKIYKTMSRVAMKRVSSYYQINDLIAEYKRLYQHYIEEVRWRV